jgi:ferredoxin
MSDPLADTIVGVSSGAKWTAEIDGDLCIGSGGCVLRAPDGFELNAARQSCPKHALLTPSEQIMDAAENCPVEAITIREAGTGKVVFPPED